MMARAAVASVYFVSPSNDRSVVKIGMTSGDHVRERIRGLQTGSPYPLELARAIPTESRQSARELEGALHDRFADSRMHGEWFRVEGGLRDFVETGTLTFGRQCRACRGFWSKPVRVSENGVERIGGFFPSCRCDVDARCDGEIGCALGPTDGIALVRVRADGRSLFVCEKCARSPFEYPPGSISAELSAALVDAIGAHRDLDTVRPRLDFDYAGVTPGRTPSAP